MNDQEIPTEPVQNEAAVKTVEKATKPRKTRKVLDKQTDLYRFFDARQDLIYVGISRSAIMRMGQHRDTSTWFGEVRTILIDKFKTRKAAAREEKRLIKLLAPRHNVTHTPFVNRLRRKIIKIYGSVDAWSEEFRKEYPQEA